MGKVAVLKAHGAFSTIPMMFASKEEGVTFVDEKFKDYFGKMVSCPWGNAEKRSVEAVAVEKKEAKGSTVYNIHNFFAESKEGREILSSFFTYYYDGNGAISQFAIDEVETNAPLVSYDTD